MEEFETPRQILIEEGVTTLSEILDAYDAGGDLVLSPRGLPLISCSSGGALFGGFTGHKTAEFVAIDENNQWIANGVTLLSTGDTSAIVGTAIFHCEPHTTTFMDIVDAVSHNGLPVINDIANGRTYYVSGYTMSGSNPVAIRFCTLEKDDLGYRYTWTVDYQDNWTDSNYVDGLYYVVPGTTTFMDIVGLLTKCTQPVINDTVNGRAYYISDYTMVDGQPAAITFSTIGANTPHTWTVDYQDNWTST